MSRVLIISSVDRTTEEHPHETLKKNFFNKPLRFFKLTSCRCAKLCRVKLFDFQN